MHKLYCKFKKKKLEEFGNPVPADSLAARIPPHTEFIQLEFKTRSERRGFMAQFPFWEPMSKAEFEILKVDYTKRALQTRREKIATILEGVSDDELKDIWCNLNNHIWDTRLGSSPEGWYNRERDVVNGYSQEELGQQYAWPVMSYIIDKISIYDILKYFNTVWRLRNSLDHMTEEEFEIWWNKIKTINRKKKGN